KRIAYSSLKSGGSRARKSRAALSVSGSKDLVSAILAILGATPRVGNFCLGCRFDSRPATLCPGLSDLGTFSVSWLSGGPCRDRTYDQEIKSLLLYQLS